MLNYLINSKTRLKLLGLLWKEGLKCSVNSLAKLSSLSFSATYEELVNMEKAGLATSELLGRSRVFSKNEQFVHKKLLLELLNLESSEKEYEFDKNVKGNEVEANLAAYGAPLGMPLQLQKKLSLEQALALGLKLSHSNPTVARALPVMFYKNVKSLNFEQLKYFASQLDEKQTLGFYLELVGELSQNSKFKRMAKKVRDRRVLRVQNFFDVADEGKYEKLLTEQNTPKVAKKWKYRMNMEFDTFQSLFNKFVSVE